MSFMEFAPVSVKLVRSKQRRTARVARLAKTTRKAVLQARRPLALATQPIRPERALRALRQLSEKLPALANRPARGQLALAAQQLDQPAPVFASRAQQPSIPSRA